MTPEQVLGLNIAFNEAKLLGVEVDPRTRIAAVTLSLQTLGVNGAAPEDPRVQVLLSPVGRVAASFRGGDALDPKAPVNPFTIDQMLLVVRAFRNQPIFGWKFIDRPPEEFTAWSDRLSCDYRAGDERTEHSIMLEQDEGGRHLDICIWFNRIQLRNPRGETMKIDDVIDAGKRYWASVYKFKTDPRIEIHEMSEPDDSDFSSPDGNGFSGPDELQV